MDTFEYVCTSGFRQIHQLGTICNWRPRDWLWNLIDLLADLDADFEDNETTTTRVSEEGITTTSETENLTASEATTTLSTPADKMSDISSVTTVDPYTNQSVTLLTGDGDTTTTPIPTLVSDIFITAGQTHLTTFIFWRTTSPTDQHQPIMKSCMKRRS